MNVLPPIAEDWAFNFAPIKSAAILATGRPSLTAFLPWVGASRLRVKMLPYWSAEMPGPWSATVMTQVAGSLRLTVIWTAPPPRLACLIVVVAFVIFAAQQTYSGQHLKERMA